AGSAIVLWHGCQIDKWLNQERENTPRAAFAAIAPILPLEAYQPADYRQGIATGKKFALFPLPPFKMDAFEQPEAYVDMRYIWSIRRSVVIRSRLVGLTEDASFSLLEPLFTFFTRLRLDLNPTCPKCGNTVQLMPAADEDDQ